MAIFTPLPAIPGLPPILSPSLGSNRPPPGNSTNTLDELNKQQGTAIYDSSNTPIYFPTTRIEEHNKQSLAPHLYPNQKVGRIENTGLDPRHWDMTIPLTDNIYPVEGRENWIAGTLLNSYNHLKEVFQDGLSHRLDLPMESVIVKVENWSFTETGEKPRDGIIIEVSFIECLDDNIPIQQTVSTPNPVYRTTATANQMESEFIRLTYFNPPALGLQGLFTQVASTIKQAVAFPNNVIASLSAMTTDLNSTATGAVGTILTSPATIYNQALSIYNQNKNTILNSVKQNIIAPITTNQFASDTYPKKVNLTYDLQALGNLTTAYQGLTNTQSVNATAFAIKALSFNVALLQYYTLLRSIETVIMQQAILTNIGLLQSIYKQLQTQSIKQYKTLSYVNVSPTTFMQAARYTNNNVEDIMKLNPSLTTLCVIPINSKILYLSATGN